ncbi:unnamed protein product [Chondrus crispus]|uniref:Uncharacterized protein n=1 Tax=Chondrus crispus TaxID=2769 RepID=R7QA99_CHOCR|nr:unnamed protein product [Chondrus crispus]CDF34708.1 unnamed protein product [Chondrus crispus]|eukprot:XP_005714527.1 unnamed protein product [Chondrus crispus]
MSTTSSAQEGSGYASPDAGSETAEEGDDETPHVNGDDGPGTDDNNPDRKRRKLSASEHTRELGKEDRMERYAKARIRDANKNRTFEEVSSKPHKRGGRGSSRSRASVQVSRSRSKSPATSQLQPSRVGKRLRRRPQRWEGANERREQRTARSTAAASSRSRDMDLASRESDGEQTASDSSMHFEPEPPSIDDPIAEMARALARCSAEHGPRAVVDSFHTWQLQAVSKQAAQQKALHVFLKRKQRKRAARTPELARLESEALRNARTATVRAKAEKAEREDEEEDDDDVKKPENASESEAEEDRCYVPSKIRLPLEAYLPRRVRADKIPITPEKVFELLPRPGRLPEGTKEERDENGWVHVETVKTPSLLNKQKAPTSKQKPTRAT